MARTGTHGPKGYPFLFSPLPLGPHTLKNRLVALPVHTGFAHTDGSVSPWMIDFYTRLAESGVAMVVVANAAVSPDGAVSEFNLRADRDEFIPGLSRLASAVKSRGAAACLQLNHAGRFAKTQSPLLPSPITAGNLAFNVESLKEFMEFFPFEKRFGLTRYLLAKIRTWGTPMTDQDRERVTQDFRAAAQRVVEAGFDMVELHGANGYLLCQYLSKFTNKMQPGSGGEDLLSRAAFPLTVVREIKTTLPPGVPLGFRLILKEWVPDGVEPDQALAFARCLEKEDIAYLSVSAATYNSLFAPDVRKKMAVPAYLEKETADLTDAVDIPVIISGRITTPDRGERILRNGAADLVGLGRPLRADLKWLQKAGTPGKKIVPCQNCNHCLKQVVLEKGFCCRQWPQWMQEQTRLEHRLLTRNGRSLWIVAGPSDIEVVGQYLPRLMQREPREPADTVVFLNDPDEDQFPERLKQEFSARVSGGIALPGAGRNPAVHSISGPRGNWEDSLLNQIRQGDYGRIFLAARPDQPWRERLLYALRGKMTALLRPHPAPFRVMVPVDLSETTLLVLRILGQTLMAHPDFSFDFIHIQSRRAQESDCSWREAKQIAGIDAAIPLERIRMETDVVSALAALLRERGYDTVVMGKRGISGIKRWLLGSVSAGLLRQLDRQSLFLID